jgi:DNA-binding SARP family transcriptional activator
LLRLTLLGVFDLQGPDGASLDLALRRTKRMALLAYLSAARPRGFHRREKVAALFWPELSDERARAALRSTLFRLREDCGVDLVVRRGAEEIAIDTNLLVCDVAEFDDAMASERFDEAATLYRGALFDGVQVEGTTDELESWIQGERSRLHSSALRALERVEASAIARGDRGVAISTVRRAIELAPDDETAARRLISHLLAAGDRGAAIREFEELARRLRRDLDVEPSAETAALIHAARASGVGNVPSASVGSLPLTEQISTRTHSLDPDFMPPSRSFRPRMYLVAVTVLLLVVWFGVRPLLNVRPKAVDVAGAETRQWHRLNALGDPPPQPRVHSVVFLDSTANALIMIGGLVSRGEGGERSPVLGDIWRLQGLDRNGSHQWRQIASPIGPAPNARWMAFGAYDSVHDRAIMHGGALGHSSPCMNDSWILDRASGVGGVPQWHEVKTSGLSPPLRAQAQGFFEPRSRSIVTFGGNDCMATYLAELWRLTFDDSTMRTGKWTRLLPDSSAGAPARRNGDAVVYDAAHRRMWVHGGNLGAGQEITELWRLDHADGMDGTPSWHPVRCEGEAPALVNHVAIYDSINGTLVLFGGLDVNSHPRNDVWSVTGLSDGGSHCRWARLAATAESPLPRASARGVLLPSGAMIVLGGEVENFALLDLWRAERGR